MKKSIFKTLLPLLAVALVGVVFATSCEKENEKNEDGYYTLCGHVVDLLDNCRGNELVVSIPSNFDMGVYDSNYNSNVIAIPLIIRATKVFEDGPEMRVDEFEFNYFMVDGSTPLFGVGNDIVFQCRDFINPEDKKYFASPFYCWEPLIPNIPRYVVTKVLSVN